MSHVPSVCHFLCTCTVVDSETPESGQTGEMTAITSLLCCLRVLGVGLVVHSTVAHCSSDRHVFPVRVTSLHTDQSACAFSDSLQVEIKSSKPFPELLVLYRKDVINTNAPAYVIKRHGNGDIYLAAIDSGRKETAAYQNMEHGAAFIAKCTQDGIHIAGTLYVEGLKYRVARPAAAVTDSLPGPAPPARATHTDYEFVPVADTQHHDDYLQGRLNRERRSNVHHDVAQPSDNGARGKRATKDYYIDVLVVLDFSFYQYWLGQAEGDSTNAIALAKDYVVYIFNGINLRFASVTSPPFRLHISISSFLIAQTAADSPWTELVKSTGSGVTQVQADVVLTKLAEYVAANYNSLAQHDHLMLFTEYDLYGDDNGNRFNNTAGFAYIGTTCYTDGRSVSVVEDHGGFQSESTATHELGHSLGALHDGDQNQCSSLDRFVMAGGIHPETDSTKRNPWIFSPCSVTYFEDHVQSLIQENKETTCLLNQVTPEGVPTVAGLPGQLSGPDEQCRQIYGPRSYLCRGSRFGVAADVCVAMFCKNPNTKSTCTLYTAAAGTCCGNGMWCLDGQCVASQDAKCYASETCPFGQRQGVVYQDKTCNELESGNCYDDNFRHVCCEMCDNARSDAYACEYGDKVSNCDSQFCGRALDSGELYDVSCCGTCNHTISTVTPVVTPPSTTTMVTEVPPDIVICRDTALVNGVQTCSEYLQQNGAAYCCQQQVQDKCCQSCRALKSNDSPCPYGDCAVCTDLETRPVPCSSKQRKSCCQTCNDLDVRLAATTTAPTITATPAPTTKRPTKTTVAVRKTTEECREILGVTTCGAAKTAQELMMLILGCMAFFAALTT